MGAHPRRPVLNLPVSRHQAVALLDDLTVQRGQERDSRGLGQGGTVPVRVRAQGMIQV